MSTLLSTVGGQLPLALGGCRSTPAIIASDDEKAAAEVLLGYFCDDPATIGAVSRVGTVYLSGFMDAELAHADLRPIVNRIVESENSEVVLGTLESDVGQDFVDLRIVPVAGWTLSQTEARICGVLAIAG
jgi:hypothetical protein